MALNANPIVKTLAPFFNETKLFLIQLFFWSALGATIACSLFLAQDKEINEKEACKKHPSPDVLRYPTNVDVHLYAQRILTSGFLGLVGAFIILAGLGYFEVPIDSINEKHKIFLIITAFVVGLHQKNFLATLTSLCKKIFEKS